MIIAKLEQTLTTPDKGSTDAVELRSWESRETALALGKAQLEATEALHQFLRKPTKSHLSNGVSHSININLRPPMDDSNIILLGFRLYRGNRGDDRA
ncbi:MAG: hypothetical protein ACYC23_16835, partial [Limisphaerales bacterium]